MEKVGVNRTVIKAITGTKPKIPTKPPTKPLRPGGPLYTRRLPTKKNPLGETHAEAAARLKEIGFKPKDSVADIQGATRVAKPVAKPAAKPAAKPVATPTAVPPIKPVATTPVVKPTTATKFTPEKIKELNLRDQKFAAKFWVNQPKDMKDSMLRIIDGSRSKGVLSLSIDKQGQSRLSAYRILAQENGYKMGPFKVNPESGTVQANLVWVGKPRSVK
jgi:hypothetical protein